MLHTSMFHGVPQHLSARFVHFSRIRPEPPTKEFEYEHGTLQRVCLQLEANAWQHKPTVTSLELCLRHAASQSALVKSGQIDDSITAILHKHHEHLTADEIYQCCLLVFGEAHPLTRYVQASRDLFHFMYAAKILRCSKLTSVDISAAHSQLLKAAELDHPSATLTLAELYEHGFGSTIAKDPVESLRWRVQYAKLAPPQDNPMFTHAQLAQVLVLQARKRYQSMQQSVD